MRIAVLAWNDSHVGGAETYVERLLAGMARRGHDTLAWFEGTSQPSRRPIQIPAGVPVVRLAQDGPEAALLKLRDWQPHVILCHGLADHALEETAIDLAPAVMFAHSYNGVCISGLRAHRMPRWKECERPFGPACLAYYPLRGCGGHNPRTMLRQYVAQRRQGRALQRYRKVIVHSAHMFEQFRRQGLPEQRLRMIYYPLWDEGEAQPPPVERREVRTAVRLLFVGRMEDSKGGTYLIEALRMVASRCPAPIEVLFVGDGSARRSWEERAARLSASPTVSIRFAGWLEGDEMKSTIQNGDAIVIPSVWSEPFGLVGPEAGLRGVPSIAFDVGGISEWLSDGFNGYLAPARPPTSKGLAEAIVRFLRNRSRHEELRRNAWKTALRFSPEAHFRALEAVVREASSG